MSLKTAGEVVEVRMVVVVVAVVVVVVVVVVDSCDGEIWNVFWSWFEFGGVVLDGSGCMLSDDDVYLW